MLGFLLPLHYNAILVLAAQAVPGEFASVFVFGLAFTFLCASALTGTARRSPAKKSSDEPGSAPPAPGDPPAASASPAKKTALLHEGIAGPADAALSLAMTPPAGTYSSNKTNCGPAKNAPPLATTRPAGTWAGPCNKAKETGVGYDVGRTGITLLAGYAIATAFLPLLFTIVPLAYAALRPVLGYVLAALCLLLALAGPRKAHSALVLLASGALGFAVLFFGFCSQPFLALFTGFFGLSNSSRKKEGTLSGTALRLPDMAAATVLSLFLVMLPAATPFLLSGAAGVFYPGALAGQQPVILMAKTLFDTASAFAIGKARSQASAYLVESRANVADLYPGIVAGAAGIIIAVLVFTRLQGEISKRTGRAATLAARVCLVALVALLSGWRGLLVAAAAFCVSKLADSAELPEGLCLGSLYAPAIAYSFGATPALARLFLGF